ncbi:MAG: hypothetical protein B7X00_01770 [Legionella sp. 21-45-4]|nr:MAG: hypothetical protein B7X00_01770 [Legionella sp. 21-45-4]
MRVLSFAVLYFAAVLTMGPWLLRYLVRALTFLPVWEKKVTVSFLFLMLLSYLATKAELASIIGAFTAGLIIKDTYFDDTTKSAVTRKSFIHDLIAPIEALLAPLFFMLIGIQVKLEMFLDVHVLAVAAGLIVAAIVGKLVSGWGASSKVDRCLIGVGMLPRGEVGLIFASIGRGLGVITDELFSAIILMVIVTTCIAPPWIKARFNRQVTEA